MVMPFNIGSPLFQWNIGQKLMATGLANGESYAHFRAASEIFCEVSTSTSLTVKVTDERTYFEKSESTGLTFTYSGTSWQVGSPASNVSLADYGITVTGTPVANNAFTVSLTDLVSVEVADGYCEIPNRLLQFASPFLVYGYVSDDNGDLTISQEQFNVIARPMPPSYIYDPTEVITYPALAKLVTDLTALKTVLSAWSVSVDSNIGTPSVEVAMGTSGVSLLFHNLKGAKGDAGSLGSVTASVDSGTGTPYIDVTYDGTNAHFAFHNLKGEAGTAGAKGDTGNGISSITLNADYTLTITFTDGTSTTTTSIRGAKGETGDTGATGNGISSIAKTSTSGNVDTYTITFTDGTTTTFTVTNGSVTSVNGETGDIVLPLVVSDNLLCCRWEET